MIAHTLQSSERIRHPFRWAAALFVLGWLLVGGAHAQTPFFAIDEIYSNADGSVQFIVMNNVASTRLAGQALVTGNGSMTHSYTFPNDLPAGAINHAFLVATQGFADLGLVAPDYVIPNGFLFVPTGFVRVGSNNAYYTVPTDGANALWFDWDGGLVARAVATNFAGQSYTFLEPASYRIESLYSNQGGWFQYIELRETSPEGRPGPLAGSVITVKRGSVVKRFVIPTDPPAGFPAGGSLIVSSVADWSSDDFGPVPPLPPDYVMPVRFLPTDGGTIDLDGQAPWTFDALPTDGSTALLRSGVTAIASGRSFALGQFSVHVEFEGIIEYFNAVLGHYFLTGSEPDLDAIESQRIKGWESTGYSLGALTVPIPTHCCSTYGQIAVPVCRFYIPPSAGDSHFFSAFAEECDEVPVKFPTFVLETRAAFYVYLPDEDTGACPVPFRPVYRMWNQRADTNHRYIYDNLGLRMTMLQQGWVPEGRGPAGVAWCI